MERIKRALELAKAERNISRQVESIEGEPAFAFRPIEAAATGNVELTDGFLNARELPVDADHLRRARLLSPGMQDMAAHSFKMLRTQVMQRLRSNHWNTLAIVSGTAGDGKSTVAINLAMAISIDTAHSALLVDFDLRRPSVARCLGIVANPGVEECLTGNRPISDVLVRLAGYDRLMILPAGGPVVHSSELLASEPTRRLVHGLKSRYTDRILLFDLPPLLGADDALAFVPEVDAVLMVVSEGHTRSEHLIRSLELLKDKPIIGAVLNRSRSDAATYYSY